MSFLNQTFNYSRLFLIFLLLFQMLACKDVPKEKEQTVTTKNADTQIVRWNKPEQVETKVPKIVRLNIIAEQDPKGIYLGLRDTASGKLVTDYRYQQIWDFKEGFAVVMLNDKFGLIDRTGKLIVEPVYEAPKGEMKCGYIAFENGFGPVVLYDTAGRVILPMLSGVNVILPCQQRITLSRNQYGMINFKGETILPFEFTTAFVVPEGFCVAEKADKTGNNRWYGLYDLNGKQVLPHVYESIDAFFNGRAIFRKNGKWGVLDENGSELISARYDRIDRYNNNGYAVVYKNFGKDDVRVGIIDKKGHEVVPVKYQWIDEVYNVYDGMVALAENRKYGFADSSGKIVIPFKYVKVESFISGIAKVWKDWHHCGYINKTGKEIIPCIFDPMDQANLRRYYDKYIIGIKDSVHHVFDYTGKHIATLPYSRLGTLNEKRKTFLVSAHNKVGSLDSNLQIKIPVIYESMEFINYGIAARKKDKIGFIYDNGKVLHPFKYDRIEVVHMPYADDYKNGLMKVGIGTKTGLMNSSKHLIIPVIYDEIENFSYGLALVRRNNKYGFVNLKGKEVIKVIYDQAKAFDGYTAEVTLNEETFLIDGAGKRVEEEY